MNYNLAIISFFLSIPILILTQRYFLKKKYIDKVISRSSHNTVATRSGGIAIFLTIFIISCFYYLIGFEIYDFSIIVPLSLLMIVGLYDDVYNMDFKLKFIFQIIAAKILVDNGLVIDNLHGVFEIFELGRIVSQILTIFIIVSIINSINFIDGIDGLALSIVLFFIISFEFFSLELTPFFNLSILLIITSVPLLYFNFKNSNKIFLGDSGSLLLGGVVSAYVIYILSQGYVIKPEYDLHKILFVLSILILPIIDIIRVFFIRIFNGKSPFEADNNHIHHFILAKTKSHFKTSLILFLGSLLFLIFIQILF